jgi:two-component system, NarL family, nitrate/nitrite sensor histidine kinase NarX
MAKDVKQSLITRSGMVLAAVLLLAICNMLASYLTAENSENDAVRINLSGSLRMQSYRIAQRLVVHWQQPAATGVADVINITNAIDTTGSELLLLEEIENFEKRFYQPVLNNYIRNSDDRVLVAAYRDVENKWQLLKPDLLSQGKNLKRLLIDIDNFVATIDVLVKKMELQTESKFKLLRLIQVISLLIAFIIVSLTFYYTSHSIVTPLRALVAMAARVRGGDFSARIHASGDDELSLLAETFNEMAESLNSMYNNLENKVKEKTLHLERVQQGARMLYEASRRLTSQDNFYDELRKTLLSVQQYINVDRVDLYISYEAVDHPFLISSEQATHTLLENFDEQKLIEEQGENLIKYSLNRGDERYGVLIFRDASTLQFDSEQDEILAALVDTIVSSLAYELRSDQQHRLALMEERTAIARELHDSLAQSLSYTKIQVSRFQMLQKQQASVEELDSALGEIRMGIQAAYGQLRELLATFRLQLDSPGLQSSLEATVVEFQQKGSVVINLDYQLENFPLSPNEEIHILQIVREALSNVVRHSGASIVNVDLKLGASGQLVVSVSDNGCGFGPKISGPNHYGRIIMSERAAVLGGDIVFSNNEHGGAQVILRFSPARVSEQQQTGEENNGANITD